MTSPTTGGKIVRNSFWWGLETSIEMLVMLASSIAVARYLGPQKLGYFSSVMFPVSVISLAGGNGLAVATRKYMAEVLGQDRPGLAHAIYKFTHRYQAVGAVVLATLGMIGVLLAMPPGYKLMAAVIVASIIPGLLSWIPAQANLAFEDAAANARSAFGYIAAYLTVIILTIWMKWDLVGIASALFVGRTVEVVLRTIPINRRMKQLPFEPLPSELKRKIKRFCAQAMAIQFLTSIVWDRSEIFFLTAFSGMLQVAFYSVSAGLVDRLLLLPKAFSNAAGISLMAESARDSKRAGVIVHSTVRFLLLVALPLHIGAAIVTRQAIAVAYGARYLPAVPVMMVATLLCIPRALQLLPDTMMRSADRQSDLIRCMIIVAILNISADLALIPHYGAIGAAWGNGLSQMVGIGLLWWYARRSYAFEWPWRSIFRIIAASLVMAALTYPVSKLIHNSALSLIASIAVAVPTYLWMIRLFHALDPYDYWRLIMLGKRLPQKPFNLYNSAVKFVVPDFLLAPKGVPAGAHPEPLGIEPPELMLDEQKMGASR